MTRCTSDGHRAAGTGGRTLRVTGVSASMRDRWLTSYVRECWLADGLAPANMIAVAATGAYDTRCQRYTDCPGRPWSPCGTENTRVLCAGRPTDLFRWELVTPREETR